MKDHLWYCSLTHFYALRYLFQASCQPSQDCKKQSWTSDGKAINCVCACVYTVEVSTRCLQNPHSVAKPYSFTVSFVVFIQPCDKIPGVRDNVRDGQRCVEPICSACETLALFYPHWGTWDLFRMSRSCNISPCRLFLFYSSRLRFQPPSKSTVRNSVPVTINNFRLHCEYFIIQLLLQQLWPVCPSESLSPRLKSDVSSPMSMLCVVHLWPVTLWGRMDHTHLLQQVSMNCGIS